MQQVVGRALEAGRDAQAANERLDDALGVVEIEGPLGIPQRAATRAGEHADGDLTLLRQVPLPGQEYAAYLEERDAGGALADAGGRRAEHRAAERRAQELLLAAQGVRDAQWLGAVENGPECRVGAAHERVGDGVLHPACHEQVADLLAEVPLRLGQELRHAACQRVGRHGVVPDRARDLLDQVLDDGDVGAPVRGDDQQLVLVDGVDLEAQRAQDGDDLRLREAAAEHAPHLRAGEEDLRRLDGHGVGVGDAAGRDAARRLEHERGGTPQRALGQLRVQPFLEPGRGLRADVQRGRGPPRVDRVERRGLHQHVGCRGGGLAVLPADDAGEADRALRVRDEEHRRPQRVLDAVECGEPLAVAGWAHDDRGLSELGEVEGVQRLAVLEHDVVRHVDDVVDGALARQLQAAAHPLWRGADLDAAQHGCRVAHAQLGVLHHDGDRVGDVLVALVILSQRLGHGVLGERGDLVRDAKDRQTVAAVRGHLDLQNVVGGQDVGERRSDGCVVAQDQDALVVVPKAELLRRAHHAGGLDAADGGRGKLHRLAGLPIDELRADGGESDALADGDVGRAADDGLRARSGLDGGKLEAVGVRVRRDVHDVADDDVVPTGARAGDVRGLQPRHRQTVRGLGRRQGQRHVFGEPGEGDSHRWVLASSAARIGGRIAASASIAARRDRTKRILRWFPSVRLYTRLIHDSDSPPLKRHPPQAPLDPDRSGTRCSRGPAIRGRRMRKHAGGRRHGDARPPTASGDPDAA